jgi:hypothetical protein
VIVASLLVLGGFGFGAYELVSRRLSGQSISFDKIQFRKVTAAGNVMGGVISADGRLIAYIASDEQGRGLWVKQVSTGNVVKLVSIPGVELWSVALSPDSSFLYYVTLRDRGCFESRRRQTLSRANDRRTARASDCFSRRAIVFARRSAVCVPALGKR